MILHTAFVSFDTSLLIQSVSVKSGADQCGDMTSNTSSTSSLSLSKKASEIEIKNLLIIKDERDIATTYKELYTSETNREYFGARIEKITGTSENDVEEKPLFKTRNTVKEDSIGSQEFKRLQGLFERII
jgi:hypothetical protein